MARCTLCGRTKSAANAYKRCTLCRRIRTLEMAKWRHDQPTRACAVHPEMVIKTTGCRRCAALRREAKHRAERQMFRRKAA